MGLDQYLTAHKLICGYTHHSEAGEREAYLKLLESVGLQESDVSLDTPHLSVSVTVAYWRKAHTVHAWFVSNVQDGVDDCRSSYASRKFLEFAVEHCRKVLKAEKPGSVISTEKDDYSINTTIGIGRDLEELHMTKDMLEPVLNNPKFKGWNFEYRASW